MYVCKYMYALYVYACIVYVIATYTNYCNIYLYIQYIHIHKNTCTYMQYIHIHAIHACTYNTYIYIPYKQHVNMIHTYACKYNPNTYMQVFVQYFKNIHANTYKYTQYDHQKSNIYILDP